MNFYVFVYTQWVPGENENTIWGVQHIKKLGVENKSYLVW